MGPQSGIEVTSIRHQGEASANPQTYPSGYAQPNGRTVTVTTSIIDTRRDLSAIEERVGRLFAMVSEGVAAAALAFLDGDREAASRIVAADAVIDALHNEVEQLVHDEFMAPDSLSELDLRFLLSVVRIVPELERSGDLVEHIAVRASQGLARQLTPRCRGLLGEIRRRDVADDDGRVRRAGWCRLRGVGPPR